MHISNGKRHLNNFKNNLKNVAEQGVNALDNERGKLLRRYDQLRNEITPMRTTSASSMLPARRVTAS